MSQSLDEKTPSLVNMPQDEKMLIESLLEYYDVDHIADAKVRESKAICYSNKEEQSEYCRKFYARI